jgi:hypothetical protein
VAQIQYFFTHWSATLPVGAALRIAVAWAQLHTGVGWLIFPDADTTLPQFEESQWLRVLISASLRADHNDSYIMDHALQCQLFKPVKIQRINFCPLYLQAATNSDIANATGTRLLPSVLSGNLSQVTSRTCYHWVYQACPNCLSWTLWKRACNIFSTAGVCHV